MKWQRKRRKRNAGCIRGTGVDGNRTRQEPRERPFNGFEGRWRDDVSSDSDAISENADSARTKINTKQLEKMDQIDPDLAAIVRAWPELSEALRAGIVAMVKASAARK